MEPSGRKLAVLFVLTLAGAAAVGAQTPSHPLSQISPSDSGLNLSDNTNAAPHNLSGTNWVVPAGSSLSVAGDLDLQGNSLLGYYASACPGGEAVQDVNSDGSFTCVSIAGASADVYVNESGDTLGGDLDMATNQVTQIGGNRSNFTSTGRLNMGDIIDMNSNQIRDVADPTTSSDAMTKGFADSEYLTRTTSDSMNGTLDMLDNNITNIARLDGFFQGACGTGEAAASVYDNGTINCSSAGAGLPSTLNINNSAGQYDIDMDGSNISALPDPISSSQPTTLGFANNRYLTRQTSDSMQGDLDMLAHEITNVDRIGNGSFPMQVATELQMTGDNITTESGGNLTIGTDVKIYGSIWVPGGGAGGGGALAAENLSQTLDAGNSAFKYDIDMNGQNISNLPDPIGSAQPVTLGFGDSRYLNRDGSDSMNGDLDLDGNNLQNVDAIGNGSTPLRFTSAVELQGNNVRTAGGAFTVNDTANAQVLLEAREGGPVEIPSTGLLASQSVNISSPGPQQLMFADDDFDANDQFQVRTADSSTNADLRIGYWDDSSTAFTQHIRFERGGNVNIPNGNINVSGGDVLLQDGSESDPVFGFNKDDDTGAYRSSTNVLSFTAGGSRRLSVNGQGTTKVRILNARLGLNGNILTEIAGTRTAFNGDIRAAHGMDARARDNSNNNDIRWMGVGTGARTNTIEMGTLGNYDKIYLGRGDGGNIVVNNTLEVSNGNLKLTDSGNKPYIEGPSGDQLKFYSGHTDIELKDAGQFFRVWDGDNSHQLMDLNSGGPLEFFNPIANEPVLQLNNSGGSNVEIPNGNLDMGSNKVEDVGTYDSSDDAMARTDILSEFVDSAGDTMTGDLKLGGHDLVNVDSLSNGTARTLEVTSTGGVRVPNGYLNVTGGELAASSTECGAGEALLGDGSCSSVTSAQNLSQVMTQGNVANTTLQMDANINMSGHNITSHKEVCIGANCA